MSPRTREDFRQEAVDALEAAERYMQAEYPDQGTVGSAAAWAAIAQAWATLALLDQPKP